MKTPKNFKCKRCGTCCTSPFLSEKEISRIKKAGYDEDYFVEELKGRKFMKLVNDRCIFLDRKNKMTSCKIHKFRPDTCRKYPTEIRDNGDCRPETISFNMTKTINKLINKNKT